MTGPGLGHDVAGPHPRVHHDLLGQIFAPVEQVGGHRLELGPGQRGLQVQRAISRLRDVRHVYLRRCRAGQIDLGLLRRFAQPLQRRLVGRQVHATGAAGLLHEMIDDALVPVAAAQVVITAGRLDRNHALLGLQQRNLERAAAQAEDQNGRAGPARRVISKRRRLGRADDPPHVKPGHLPGLPDGLSLGLTEYAGTATTASVTCSRR